MSTIDEGGQTLLRSQLGPECLSCLAPRYCVDAFLRGCDELEECVGRHGFHADARCIGLRVGSCLWGQVGAFGMAMFHVTPGFGEGNNQPPMSGFEAFYWGRLAATPAARKPCRSRNEEDHGEAELRDLARCSGASQARKQMTWAKSIHKVRCVPDGFPCCGVPRFRIGRAPHVNGTVARAHSSQAALTAAEKTRPHDGTLHLAEDLRQSASGRAGFAALPTPP